MRKLKWCCSSILLLSSLLVAHGAVAQLYSYTDENGQRHFTNVPTDSRYRPAIVTKKQKKSQPLAAWKRGAHANASLYDSQIQSAAERYQVETSLLKAIILVESSFDRYAVSKRGAQGLMQLMPKTAEELQVSDPFNPRQNIFGGTRYFRQLLNMYDGNLALSLAAYNAGPGRVTKNGKIPAITETQNYVRRVLSHYEYYLSEEALVTSIKVSELVTVN